MKYVPVNLVLFGQWNDNKVVSFILTLCISGSVTVSRRVGAQTVELPIKIVLKQYSIYNFMGGVNNVDKVKKLEVILQRKLYSRNGTAWGYLVYSISRL